MKERPGLDVSQLPLHGYSSRAPLWWGNLLMIVTEATMFAIVIGSYFYISKSFSAWPPRPIPDPDLLLPTINLIVMIVSLAPEIAVHLLAVRGGSQRSIQIGLVVSSMFLIAAVTLRFFEFNALKVKWDANAYGSIAWAALSLHLGHLIAATGETFVLTAWVFTHRLDEKHRLDLSVTAIYWYFVVVAWAVLYPIIYLSPRAW
ncbi:MAG TPA: cytochrome c oxidase subunit 3 [Blastocatellia bacterium]|nr:cytochrome c oxidase subunit 3 [Blastocatellia bacterium]